jgi:hypothetical protein
MKHYEMTLSPNNLSMVRKILTEAKKEHIYFIAKRVIMAIYFDCLVTDNYSMDDFQSKIYSHLKRLFDIPRYELCYDFGTLNPKMTQRLKKMVFYTPNPTPERYRRHMESGYFYGHPIRLIWNNSPAMGELEKEINRDYYNKQEQMKRWKNSYTEDGWRIMPRHCYGYIDDDDPWFWD